MNDGGTLVVTGSHSPGNTAGGFVQGLGGAIGNLDWGHGYAHRQRLHRQYRDGHRPWWLGRRRFYR